MSAVWRVCGVWLVAGCALALGPVGCSDDDVVHDVADDGGDAEEHEADDGDEPEWGFECEVAEDCDDGIDCTVDACDRGLCRNTTDDEVCQDGQVCNGEEVCSVRDNGCIPGAPERRCNDGDPCTMDRCIEPEPGMAPGCDYLPLDRDGDTFVDDSCDGDDCNDVDPLSNPDSLERCFDTFDNDCDTLTDLLDPTCQMNFDNCTSPRELESGVEWEAFTNGAIGDVSASCDISSFADVVFSFEVTATSDVLVSVDARTQYAYAALQGTCGDPASELRCSSGSQISIFEHALAPGTYYLTVSGWDDPATTGDELTFMVRVDISPAGPAQPGDTCADPVEIPTLPAHVEGDLTRMDDDVSLTCASWMDGADAVYTFDLAEASDVTIDVASSRLSPYVALQSECAVGTGDVLVCDSGWPFHRVIGNVPAGTYYLWVEATGAGAYSVDVSASPPTPPPDNDVCTGAVDISAGGTFEGSLLSAANDYSASCTSTTLDVTYVLTLTETKMVALVLQAHYDLWPYMVVTTECGTPASELICQWYEYPTTVDWRMLDPGTYYVIVEADDEGTFALTATISDPVDPCAGLEVIDAGGEFTGTTVGMFDDFAGTCVYSTGLDYTYEVQVAADSHFTAQVEVNPATASCDWDATMYLWSTCGDPATELACNDDGGGTLGLCPLIDVPSLAAGTYYLTVDGLGSWASGPYTLDVTMTPL